MRTLQRLESGEMTNPKLRFLVNCAVALQCSIEELVEDDWLVFHEMEGVYSYSWSEGDPRGQRARLCGSA